MAFYFYFFQLSTFLRNFFLCWDRWNGDVTPTLDAALLCSSRAGADLGCDSGLVRGALNHHSAIYHIPLQYWNYCNTQANWACLIASTLSSISTICHPAPCYLNSDKVFPLLSDQYRNPERGSEPGT